MTVLAAANPDTTPFGWHYALTVIGFVLAVGLSLVALRAIHVAVTRNIRRHADRALTRGDDPIRDAADAMYAARRRPSVPRQPERTRP